MSNPRNIVDFTDIDARFATFYADGVTLNYSASLAQTAQAGIGLACSLSADSTVQLTSDGEAILGRVIQIEPDNKVVVQVAGFMKLPAGNGATITRGKKLVGALGAASAKGYVRDVATGTAAELGLARGIVVDKSDTTNVVAYF